MWEVMKKFHSLTDRAHVGAIASLDIQIDSQLLSNNETFDTLQTLAALVDTKDRAVLSGTFLVKATVLFTLRAFVAFATKEIFKLVLPDAKLPAKPSFMKHLIEPLKEARAFTDFPRKYRAHVWKYCDADEDMRNQFAHGDWHELARKIDGFDIEKAFQGTAALMKHFETKLRRSRPDLAIELKAR